LTAVKQIIAQKNQYELNRLYIATDVTRKIVEEIDASAKEGSYVFGFVLEGARWDIQL
jgi:dynein heavy chain